MKIVRQFSLVVLIAIVLICIVCVSGGPTPKPIGVSETDDSFYLWCDDLDEESEPGKLVNEKGSPEVEADPASGTYELIGVLS